tara:strand:+ start:115 stop:543 length:429 start_codon:yes stop_codon:yes gene_type:complete
MKKIFWILVIFFLISVGAYSLERSEKEIKIGVFLDDLKEIGDFKKINDAPDGMFPEIAYDFHKKQVISQKEFINIFIHKKGLLEKYTDRALLGMAYFEFFYMQQLKDNKRSIEIFREKYPDINTGLKKEIKKAASPLGLHRL